LVHRLLEGSTLSNLSQEDTLVRNMLRKSGLQYDLIDLSKGMRARLRGTLRASKRPPHSLLKTVHEAACWIQGNIAILDRLAVQADRTNPSGHVLPMDRTV
jgi:hypothetical protein